MFLSSVVLLWGVGIELGADFEGPPWEFVVSSAGDLEILL